MSKWWSDKDEITWTEIWYIRNKLGKLHNDWEFGCLFLFRIIGTWLISYHQDHWNTTLQLSARLYFSPIHCSIPRSKAYSELSLVLGIWKGSEHVSVTGQYFWADMQLPPRSKRKLPIKTVMIHLPIVLFWFPNPAPSLLQFLNLIC